ncbi:MAG: phosphoglucosamine mutase [Pseudomonadota bacterium]
MNKISYFGTDGIRGKANSDHMNTEIGVSLGRAVANYVRNFNQLPQIVIGKDPRLSGYMIETAIASGITSMGLNVIKTGPLPTPGIAFICNSMRARMGIMISASHNPSDENGIKLFDQHGFKLSLKEELFIEDLMVSDMYKKNLAKPNCVGKITQIHDADGRYVQYLKERFPHGHNLNDVKIALDCANGAAYSVAPKVFSELGADVFTINNEPDGHNINKNCGSLYPEKICEYTKKMHTDIGITFDGDADRVILSDEKGNVVDGDAILYISAKHLNSKKQLGRSSVVGTIMSNQGLDLALKKEGIKLIRTDVGDHNVISYMRGHGINLGGESCGHLIYLHHSSTGDGILAALRVLSIMQQQQRPLSEIVKGYHPFPQKTVNVEVKRKVDFDNVKNIAKVKMETEKELKGKGRLIIRYSGTENIARITVESKDEKLTNKLVKKLSHTVEENLGK